MIDGSIILVTGGTGSWGNELVKQLLEQNPKEVRIYSRGEFAQVIMQRKFNDNRLKFIIGDVRDLDALKSACIGVNIVIHLSALKHVPICEQYPDEAIKTNIIGTQNLIEAAILNKVDKVVDVSTDKACGANNLYGMTKAVGEKLILNANNKSSTKFVVIRGGNVLGSNGSVVPLFIKQLKDGKNLTITDANMTRYFLTLPEAIKLLFTAIKSDLYNCIFVMKMPSFKIIDIAKVLIEHYIPNKKVFIDFTGIRLGEKIHEVLISKAESISTYVYNKNYYVISYDKVKLPKVDFEEYTSNTYKFNVEDIKKLLKNGGYL